MKKRNLFRTVLLSLLAAVAITSCAKANDPAITEPEKNGLTVLKKIDTQGYARDLDVKDSLLFIAEDQAGFSIYNLKSNQLLIRYNTDLSNIRLIKFLRNYLFVYNKYGTSNTAIIVFDVTNPTLPANPKKIIGTTQDVTEIILNRDTTDSSSVFFDWVSDKTLKINNKFNLFPYPGNELIFTFPVTGFDRDSTYTYLACEQFGINIVRTDSGTIKRNFDTEGSALDVEASGSLLFAALQEAGIVILDKSNLDNIVKLFAYNTSGYAQHLDYADDYLAVASGGGGVYLFDLHDKNNIKLAGHLEETEIGYAYKVKISDGYIYAATKSGVYKIKINS